mmetsp:Transcript_12110/g.27013  ORF Transcript_12110/g.27013 Transcript_12110/m.27013 type:complete len:116 (+) Transcript_12110:437-784(+)
MMASVNIKSSCRRRSRPWHTLVAERSRDVAVAYYHILDETVTGSASHDNAEAYAAQVIQEIVSSRTTCFFFCFCKTTDTQFKVAFLRLARDAGLMAVVYTFSVGVEVHGDFHASP